MNDTTLNLGFDLAMEWGHDWLRPIQSRLKKLRPDLSSKQLRECNEICQATMKDGHLLVCNFIRTGADIDQDGWTAEMRTKYPWMSEENLDRCFSQGCYYAMK